ESEWRCYGGAHESRGVDFSGGALRGGRAAAILRLFRAALFLQGHRLSAANRRSALRPLSGRHRHDNAFFRGTTRGGTSAGLGSDVLARQSGLGALAAAVRLRLWFCLRPRPLSADLSANPRFFVGALVRRRRCVAGRDLGLVYQLASHPSADSTLVVALVRRARGLAACAFVLVFLTAPARAQLIPPQPTQWLVSPGFGKSEAARMNISGAACAVTTPPFRACLAVNDEESYAQTFRIAGRTLVPGPIVPLLGKSGSDPDAEGAAYDNGYFYAIGSHGLSRHNGKLHESAFLVFRLRAAVQPANAPGEIAAPVETSGKLRAALRDAESVGAFAEKPLNAGGINIEGIAVAGGRLYAGLRAPNLENRGFVLSAALDGVFGNKPLAAKVHAL